MELHPFGLISYRRSGEEFVARFSVGDPNELLKSRASLPDEELG
jgi:hypothetical protein